MESITAMRPRRSLLHRFVAAGALAGLAALAAPATAGPLEDMRTCIEASGEPAVIACTRAIASNAFKERDLASLHAMRGAELSRTGQHDLALADYDLAIKIEPSAARSTHTPAAAIETSGFV